MELIDRLKKIKEKFDQINQQLSDPQFLSDRAKIVSLSKERSELEDIVQAYDEYSEVLNNINENEEIISSNIDKELTNLAEEELKELEEKKINLEEELKILLLPKDPSSQCIVKCRRV